MPQNNTSLTAVECCQVLLDMAACNNVTTPQTLRLFDLIRLSENYLLVRVRQKMCSDS